ncbi:hypothetical protein DEO72_LG6g1469 [Vigna unguiculata]|uniref:Uncharacterized protein n=1 Tax=Vigna unguiculata TaxID=3917 RepID=A0A4D6M7U9_VIGUN|nr:hypothetical protein DEO72_LG6g1469 [Vigna unguiculata]
MELRNGLIYLGTPPWTLTNRGHGITSQPLKHYPEISPRDFKELRTDTDQTYSINQAEGSRSGELPSPRRELDNLEHRPFTLVRLGEISSPERGILMLKIRMARLSDSSRKRPGRASASLA